jgi:dolichyl-phosphooligosaccharide-protein glycotransferase
VGKKKQSSRGKYVTEEQHAPSSESDAKSEEDLKINLSWAKSFFAGAFVKKYWFVLLILIPLLISVHIRTLPAAMPVAEDWARQSIYDNIRNNIAAGINQQYPNLPQQNKEALINEQFSQFVSQESAQIEQVVQDQAAMIRQRFSDNGNVYLGDIDSYFWMRYARNIIDKDQYGDEIIDGVQYDTRMMAPLGMRADVNIYPYFIAYSFWFLRLFNPEISIMLAAFYTPLLLSFIAIIAAFMLGRKLAGNLAGLIASILVAVNPTLLSRTLGSDNDMVSIVFPLLIMLFTVYAFDSKNIKEKAIFTVLAGISVGLFSFAWSGWWFMFLFILGAAVAYIFYLAAHDFFKTRNIAGVAKSPEIRRTGIFLVLFLVVTFVTLALLGNHEMFFRSFLNPIKITQIKSAAHVSLWPNVYTTVAELSEANLAQVVRSLGGNLFFWIALMGTVLSLVTFKREKLVNSLFLAGSALYFSVLVTLAAQNTLSVMAMIFLVAIPLFAGLLLSVIYKYEIKPLHSIIMVIWFVATIYAASKGVRFILLMTPAFAVSFALFFAIITEWLSGLAAKMLDFNKVIAKGILSVLILFILIQPVQTGIATAYHYVPSINDAWFETLTKIRHESSPDAIINSWWDFGHWFKYVADRAVTFDGASQNSPQAHWIGKVLLTDDEEQAVAILRMLDCRGNMAFDTLNEEFNDTYFTVNLVYELLDMDEQGARLRLRQNLSPEKTEEVISYMYCEPPENYFITSGDMVGKSGVWAHFGIWDFKRTMMFNYYQDSRSINEFYQLMTEFNYSQTELQRYYYEMAALRTDREVNDWIAPWPGYAGESGCSILNNTMNCGFLYGLPMTIDLKNNDAYIMKGETKCYPPSFGYLEDGEFNVKVYENDTYWEEACFKREFETQGIRNIPRFSVVARQNSIVIMAPELTGSMFTRLYYLDGIGLEHFNKFHDVTDITGSRIITWKVDWN